MELEPGGKTSQSLPHIQVEVAKLLFTLNLTQLNADPHLRLWATKGAAILPLSSCFAAAISVRQTRKIEVLD